MAERAKKHGFYLYAKYDTPGWNRGLNKLLSHKPGVRAAVFTETFAVGVKARAILAGHRLTGASRIRVVYAKTDGWVILEDKGTGGLTAKGKPSKRVQKKYGAAAAIEFGADHWTVRQNEDGSWTVRLTHQPGLWILHDAAGLRRPKRNRALKTKRPKLPKSEVIE